MGKLSPNSIKSQCILNATPILLVRNTSPTTAEVVNSGRTLKTLKMQFLVNVHFHRNVKMFPYKAVFGFKLLFIFPP